MCGGRSERMDVPLGEASDGWGAAAAAHVGEALLGSLCHGSGRPPVLAHVPL